jgi:hypothetical protein
MRQPPRSSPRPRRPSTLTPAHCARNSPSPALATSPPPVANPLYGEIGTSCAPWRIFITFLLPQPTSRGTSHQPRATLPGEDCMLHAIITLKQLLALSLSHHTLPLYSKCSATCAPWLKNFAYSPPLPGERSRAARLARAQRASDEPWLQHNSPLPPRSLPPYAGNGPSIAPWLSFFYSSRATGVQPRHTISTLPLVYISQRTSLAHAMYPFL